MSDIIFEYALFRQTQADGQLEGVGLFLRPLENFFMVSGIKENSAASSHNMLLRSRWHRYGLRSIAVGDHLISVNGAETLASIRAHFGTSPRLLIRVRRRPVALSDLDAATDSFHAVRAYTAESDGHLALSLGAEADIHPGTRSPGTERELYSEYVYLTNKNTGEKGWAPTACFLLDDLTV